MKCKLYYSALNSNSDVEYLEFRSPKKRAEFIADKVIGVNPKRVFTLIIYYSRYPDHNHFDVYVFDDYYCIFDVVKLRWNEFGLYEWPSYEEAYKYALHLKEVSPLCYTTTMK